MIEPLSLALISSDNLESSLVQYFISFEALIKIASVYNQTPSEFLKDFEDYAKANS